MGGISWQAGGQRDYALAQLLCGKQAPLWPPRAHSGTSSDIWLARSDPLRWGHNGTRHVSYSEARNCNHGWDPTHAWGNERTVSHLWCVEWPGNLSVVIQWDLGTRRCSGENFRYHRANLGLSGNRVGLGSKGQP